MSNLQNPSELASFVIGCKERAAGRGLGLAAMKMILF